LDERSGIYQDIGDKKATEKTSQALREGQTKIRKKIYYDENEATELDPDFVPPTPPTNIQREMSSEAYLGYSVQVLEALYIADENASDRSMTSDNKMVVATAAVAAAQANNIGPGIVQRVRPTSPSSAALLDSIAMMKALEQLHGAAPPAHSVAPTQQEQDQNQNQNQNRNQNQNQNLNQNQNQNQNRKSPYVRKQAQYLPKSTCANERHIRPS